MNIYRCAIEAKQAVGWPLSPHAYDKHMASESVAAGPGLRCYVNRSNVSVRLCSEMKCVLVELGD